MTYDRTASTRMRQKEQRRFEAEQDKQIQRITKDILTEQDRALNPEKYSRRAFIKAATASVVTVSGGYWLATNQHRISFFKEMIHRMGRRYLGVRDGLHGASALVGETAFEIADGAPLASFSAYDLAGFNRMEDIPSGNVEDVKFINAIHTKNKDFYNHPVTVPFDAVIALFSLAKDRGFQKDDLTFIGRPYPDDPQRGSLEEVLVSKVKDPANFSYNPMISILDASIDNIEHRIDEERKRPLSEDTLRSVWERISRTDIRLDQAPEVLEYIFTNHKDFPEVDDRIRSFRFLNQKKEDFTIGRNIRLGLYNMRRAQDFRATSAARFLGYHLLGVPGLRMRLSDLKREAPDAIGLVQENLANYAEHDMRSFQLRIVNPIRNGRPLPELTYNGDYDYWRPNQYQQHMAIDIEAPIGTSVYPTAEGMVIFAGTNGGSVKGTKLGNFIYVLHDNRIISVYGHLSKGPLTKETFRRFKDRIPFYVSERRPFAETGDSGNAQGRVSHLHFALKDASEAYANPLSFFAPQNRQYRI